MLSDLAYIKPKLLLHLCLWVFWSESLSLTNDVLLTIFWVTLFLIISSNNEPNSLKYMTFTKKQEFLLLCKGHIFQRKCVIQS